MYLQIYSSGLHWAVAMISSPPPGLGKGQPKCQVLEDIEDAVNGGKFNYAKLDERIEQISNDPTGLAYMIQWGDHPAYSAKIGGQMVQFWGIRVGNYRLYAFEGRKHLTAEKRKGLIIAAVFSTKKTQTTSKQNQVKLKGLAKRYFEAEGADQVQTISLGN